MASRDSRNGNHSLNRNKIWQQEGQVQSTERKKAWPRRKTDVPNNLDWHPDGEQLHSKNSKQENTDKNVIGQSCSSSVRSTDGFVGSNSSLASSPDVTQIKLSPNPQSRFTQSAPHSFALGLDDYQRMIGSTDDNVHGSRDQRTKYAKLLTKLKEQEEALLSCFHLTNSDAHPDDDPRNTESYEDMASGEMSQSIKMDTQKVEGARSHSQDVPEHDQVVNDSNSSLMSVQQDLEEMQRQLKLFRDLQNCGDNSLTEPGCEVEEAAILSDKHQQLQDKLHDLQEKKKQMSVLLHELHSLKAAHESVANVDEACSIQGASPYVSEDQEMLQKTPDQIRKLKGALFVPTYRLEQQSGLGVSEQNHRPTREGTVEQPANFVRTINGVNQEVDKQTKNIKQNNIQRNLSSDDLAESGSRRVSRSDNVRQPSVRRNVTYDDLAHTSSRNYPCGRREVYGAEAMDVDQFVGHKTSPWKSDKQKLSNALMKALLNVVQRAQTEDGIDVEQAEQLLANIVKVEDVAPAGPRKRASVTMDTSVGERPNEGGGVGGARAAESQKMSGVTSIIQENNEQLETLVEERSRLLVALSHLMKLQHDFPVNESQCSPFNELQLPLRPEPANQVALPPRSNRQDPLGSLSSAVSNPLVQDKNARRRSSQASDAMSSTRISDATTISLDMPANEGHVLMSNQEVWAKMRQQLILREELRQKKRELEELMRKDRSKIDARNQDNLSDNVSLSKDSEVLGISYIGTEGTSAATWGGSTSEYAEEQNRSPEEREHEDNDGCSSDELAAGDEEEEEEEPVQEFTNNRNFCDQSTTNKISQPAKFAQNIATNSAGRSDSRSVWMSSNQGSGQSATLRTHSDRVRQENLHRADELVADQEVIINNNNDLGNNNNNGNSSEVWQLQQQLDHTNTLCQSILRDQHMLANLLHQQSAGPNNQGAAAASEGNRSNVPEMLTNLQQQQVVMNLNQCLYLLNVQQLEIHQLQQQLQQVMSICGATGIPHISNNEQNNTGQQNSPVEFEFRPINTSHWFNLVNPAAAAPPSQVFSLGINNSSPGSCLLNLNNSSVEASKAAGEQALNNQVPPGTRANNYWDNFRSYSRQNLLSTGSKNESAGTNSLLTPPQVVNALSPPTRGWVRDVDGTVYIPHPSQPVDPARLRHLNCVRTNMECGKKDHTRKEKFNKNEVFPVLAPSWRCEGEGHSLAQHTPAVTNIPALQLEAIQEQVSALIVQNENRPHLLMDILRQLREMQSDSQIQKAAQLLQNLATQPITQQATSTGARPKNSSHNGASTRHWTTDQTASESLFTSEDEEVKSHLWNTGRGHVQDTRHHFDYNEPDGNTSTSTPVKVDQVLSQFETINDQNFIAHAEGVVTKTACQARKDRMSQVSNSGMSMINIQLIEDEVQKIMVQIVPFLKSHLDDVCSSRLLGHFHRLLLSRASAHITSQERAQDKDLLQFFQRQLSNVLEDTLTLYKGKRMRECGPHLLLDVFEVLFNELSLVRMIQNMGGTGAQSRARNIQALIQLTLSSPSHTPLHDLQNQSDIEEAAVGGGDNPISSGLILISNTNEEEEDLGKSRDDAMASQCEVVTPAPSHDNTPVNRQSINLHTDSSEDEYSVLPWVMHPQRLADDPEEGLYVEAECENESEGVEDHRTLAEADQSPHCLQNDVFPAQDSSQPESTPHHDQVNGEMLANNGDITLEDDPNLGAYAAASPSPLPVNCQASPPAYMENEQGLDRVPIKLRARTPQDTDSPDQGKPGGSGEPESPR